MPTNRERPSPEQATFFVARHGETDWNAVDRFQGHEDIVLNQVGENQARKLGQRLREEKIDAVYSSDLRRALRTAKIVTEQLAGFEIIQDARLRERSFGVFQGLTMAEAIVRYPLEMKKFGSWDAEYIIPQGESNHQKHRRVVDFFEEMAIKHRGETVLVITHGGVLDSLLRHTMNIHLNQPRHFKNYNASLNRFYKNERGWFLATWGDVNHLR